MPAKEPDQVAKPKRNAPLWVKIFVPLHIIAITSWALPHPPDQNVGNPPRVPLKIRTDGVVNFVSSSAEYLRTEFLIGNDQYVRSSPLKFYLLSTGFWQYWDMFSPNPASVDIYSDALVYYANGNVKKYQYPRMFSLSLGQKFLKERWRKFFERAGDKQYAYLRPVFGQRVALMMYNDPKNPPVKVELFKHEMVINPPGQPQNTSYTNEGPGKQPFFTWFVNVDQLRREKGF